jgi:hypothetical protein
MRFSTLVALAVALAAPALAVPTTLKSVERFSGETNGGYIVTFKSAAARRTWAQKLKATELNLIEGIACKLFAILAPEITLIALNSLFGR